MFPIAISARSDAAQLTLHEITVPDSGREIFFHSRIWDNDLASRLIAVVIGIRT